MRSLEKKSKEEKSFNQFGTGIVLISKMRYWTYIAFIALLFTTVDADAQRRARAERGNRGPSWSIGFQAVQPRGEFQSIYDGNPVGIGGSFLINGARSPFEFGVGYGWQSMGKQEEGIRILEGQNIDGEDVYASGQMTVNSNIHTYQVIARFKPFTGKIQPYVDGLLGFKAFTTKTTILADNGSYSEVVDEDKEARDVSAFFGWAAGIKVEVARSFMLEGRFEAIEGGKTIFINPETIEIDKEGGLSYDRESSATDVYVFQLGFSIEF